MNKNRHVLIVINPKAGSLNKEEKEKVVQKLYNMITDKGWTHELYKTTGENDGDAILKLTQKTSFDRVVIIGGDGTINLVAHGLREHPVLLGVIPSGSANGLAFNLNLPDKLEEQIEVALGDKFIEIDHLKINENSCLHIADLGLNAELIHNFQDSGIRGKFGYLLQSIPTLIHTEGPFAFEIEIDGKLMERSGILLAIANAKHYGTGATINPNGRMDDGKFEVLVFKELNTLEIIKTIYDKVDLSTDFAECFSTDKVVITTKNPVPFQMDGEPMGKTNKVEASIYPKRLRFAV